MSANLNTGESGAGGAVIGTADGGAGASSGGAAAQQSGSTGEWESFEEFANAHENPPPAPGAAASTAGAAGASAVDPSKTAEADPAAAADPSKIVDPAAAPKKYDELPADHPLVQELRQVREHRDNLDRDLKTHKTQAETFNQQLARYQALGGDKFFDDQKQFFETAWNPAVKALDYLKSAAALSGVHTVEKMADELLSISPSNVEYAIRRVTGREDLTLDRVKRLAEADKDGTIKLPEENKEWMTAEERERHDREQTERDEFNRSKAAFEQSQRETAERERTVRVAGLTNKVKNTYMNSVFAVAQEQGFVPKPDEETKAPELYARKSALTTIILKAAVADLAEREGFQRAWGLAESEAPSVDYIAIPDAQTFSTNWGLLLKQIQPLIAADALGRVEAADKIAGASGDSGDIASAAAGLPAGSGKGDNYGYTDEQWQKMTQDERDAAFSRHLDARRKGQQIASGVTA